MHRRIVTCWQFVLLILSIQIGALLFFAPGAAWADRPAEPQPTPAAGGGACTPATPCADERPFGMLQLSDQVAMSAPARALAAPQAESQPRSSGFGMATAVALLLAAALLYALVAAVLAALGQAVPSGPAWLEDVIPILCLLGLGVAGYLTYVETQDVAAVCGPVGDCNAVQASPYARLFGFLPVGLLGMIGYVAILGAWAVGRFGRNSPAPLARLAALALLGMALFGALFSLYLTYLELYIIRAVCAWCLTSAVIMALLLLLTVGPAARTLAAEEEG
jgi:uncharacterized membrane protein